MTRSQSSSVNVVIEPEETHVFVVGISSYHIGGAGLPNAAEHAVRFVEWARQAGVLPNRIHCFLSAPELEKYSDLLAKLEVLPRRATSVEIRPFVDVELKGLSGKLLLLFWAGHGSFADEKRRILFYEDLTQENQPHFDLTHQINRLRHSPYGINFPLQIGYVQGCVNPFNELGYNFTAGFDQPGIGDPVSGVRQSIFLAADDGQQAVDGR